MIGTYRIWTRGAALVVAGGLSLWAGFAHSHDGAHTAPALARIDRATAVGHEVRFDLTVTGLQQDHGISIAALGAEGAADMRFAQPVALPFAQDIRLTGQLRFAAPPPGIFTLMIDFGTDGQGGVIVIPEPAASFATHDIKEP